MHNCKCDFCLFLQESKLSAVMHSKPHMRQKALNPKHSFKALILESLFSSDSFSLCVLGVVWGLCVSACCVGVFKDHHLWVMSFPTESWTPLSSHLSIWGRLLVLFFPPSLVFGRAALHGSRWAQLCSQTNKRCMFKSVCSVKSLTFRFLFVRPMYSHHTILFRGITSLLTL